MTVGHSGDEVGVFERYALAGGRYKQLLGGRFMRLPMKERELFGGAMAVDAAAITDQELFKLFAGDWRERLTAAWLAGFSKRLSQRALMAGMINSGELGREAKGCYFAMARFGDVEASRLLLSALQRDLHSTGVQLSQPWALGALIYLDRTLRIDMSASLLSPNGLWESWSSQFSGTSFDALGIADDIAAWCDFAERHMHFL